MSAEVIECGGCACVHACVLQGRTCLQLRSSSLFGSLPLEAAALCFCAPMCFYLACTTAPSRLFM